MQQIDGKRVLILSAGVGGGHNSAARALQEAFRQAGSVAEVQMLDSLELGSPLYKALYSDAYFRLVELAPWLVSMAYDANDVPFRDDPLSNIWEQVNSNNLVRRIREYRPDAVVSTHFQPARLISLLTARGEFQAHNSVVATDYDVQGLWLSSPFSHFFVPRWETRAYMIDIGLPEDRVTWSGVPVSAAFSRPLDRDAVLSRYNLDAGRPILLISAGAAGSEFTHRIIEQTLRMESDFQALVVCGRSRKLQSELAELTRPHPDRYRLLGYTTEMPDLMRVSSLFVGKPGGLSSSECMAAGLPMALVKPIPGQEERNADYLLEEGAAVRCNYDTIIGQKLDRLLSDPARLERMAAAARRVGRPQAAQTIVETVLADDAAPLAVSRAAQASILAAAEAGESARYLRDAARVHTLADPVTGRSTQVLTAAEADEK